MEEPSVVLLGRARAGDEAATNELLARYLPRLRKWATGRLPSGARDLNETDDIVQEAVLRTVRRLDVFEVRHDGALLAYLRQAVLHRILDEVRRAHRRSGKSEAASMCFIAEQTSPLEACIGQETLERYEAALSRLRSEDRALIVAKLEMNSDYEEMALAFGKPSAGAARVAAARALVQLAKEMKRGKR